MTTVSSRHETGRNKPGCAAPGCTNTITAAPTGRPARFCSDACRRRAHRHQQRTADTPVSVEIDTGSASSRGRTPDNAWLVRLRRADRTVIIAIGLRRNAADRLAEQIDDLLNPHPSPVPTMPNSAPTRP